MFKWLLKWGLRWLLVAVVLVVIGFLSRDSIVRIIIQHNIRKQTGMLAEIGKFHFGLTEPVVDIKNLQLYNPACFGGTPFLNIPEIHVEYDPLALQKKQIRVTLLRFNLGELDIVKNQAGLTNIFSLGGGVPTSKKDAAVANGEALAQIKQQTDLDFKGIDCLNVSVGTFKYVDLQNQKNNREQNLGIQNFVVTNVASLSDLTGLGVLVGLRSGDFFKPLVDPGGASAGQSVSDLLQLLGH